MRGGEAALVSVGVYTAVSGAYAVLRVRRALLDQAEQQGPARAVEYADMGEPQMA